VEADRSVWAEQREAAQVLNPAACAYFTDKALARGIGGGYHIID
jgi:hypothetical protein